MKTLMSLRKSARKLWPNNQRNQREWLRAVRVVRDTTTGWHLDRAATPERTPFSARVLS